MSTSPTKGDNNLPTPKPQGNVGPSAGRRGHAHRRSAAISCHDVSMIIKPPSIPGQIVGGSAPVSPSEERPKLHFSNSLDNTLRNEFAAEPNINDPATDSSKTPPTRQAKTARVGFSDTLEFIPRPLSLVSSDASSTATFRQSHSVSGSLSSIVSNGAASLPSKEQQRGLLSPALSNNVEDIRPSTAGPVLGSACDNNYFSDEAYVSRRQSSIPPAAETPLVSNEAPSTPRSTGKRYFFFGHDASVGDISPNISRPASAGSAGKARNTLSNSAPTSPDLSIANQALESLESVPPPLPPRRNSVTRKSGKKQKKVKSWAGSILSRKPRPRSQKQKGLSRRSPTPPLRSYEPSAYELVSFPYPSKSDEATQSSLSTVNPVTTNPSIATNFANWRPRQVISQDDDSTSPIIDLDAALGPFNTPTGHDLEWDTYQRSSGPTKRRMHSAAGMKGFKGPGMHYHRRAESAPEMVAFENPRFGVHRIGSSSTMEDVFEEDEEDDWEEVKTVSHKGSTIRNDDDETSGLGIEIKVVDAETGHDSTMDWTAEQNSIWQRGLKRKGSGLSEVDKQQNATAMKSERSVSPLRETFTADDLEQPPKFGDDGIVMRPVSSSKSSSSSLTPPFRPHAAKDLAPVEVQSFSTQPPYLTPTTPNSLFQSPFPSPRTRVSYDAQIISTAPSSIVDEPAFGSMWLGEPGPEIRMSVDDVPSLTSSNSTMTRDSMINPAFGNPQFRQGQRSASLSGPSVQRNKRSSIASLSRLLSSHGEKSKLYIEERAPESPERKKDSKTKRLSRIMQFWKPGKEESSERSTCNTSFSN
jgi:hypothetical protein